MTQDQKQPDILQFWRLVEFFTPQTVPKVTRGGGEDIVIEWNPREALPWQSLPPAAPNRVWRHTVYLGLYELSEVYETLHKAFRDDRDAYDPRPSGRSACAGLVVDEDGCLVSGSAVLSTCAWALGRIRRSPRRHDVWIGEFDQAQASLAESIQAAEDRRSKAAGTPSVVALGTRTLEELRRIVVTLTGLDRVPELSCRSVVIQSRQVSQEAAIELSDYDFMNSLYLDDLGKIRQAADEGGVGAGLRRYLTSTGQIDESERVDVRDHPEAVTSGVSAERIPLARWPSDPDHPLAVSQQFAVNEAIHGPTHNSGLLGINAPPGTGKTTLLRDLIAHNIVERARKLAELATPGDGFEAPDNDLTWTSKGHPRRAPKLRPEIAGFEMIVASANHAAVENLTAEISAAGAIAQPWQGHVEHFTNLASRILRDRPGGGGPTPNGSVNDRPGVAWALISATLGSQANRNAFIDSFWWAKRGEGEAPDTAGFEQLLKAPNPEPRSWKDAVAEFEASLRKAQGMRAERVEAERRWHLLPVLNAKLAGVGHHVEEATQSRHALRDQLAEHDRMEAAAEAACIGAREAMERQQAAKPGFWETLVSFGRAMREWRPGFEASEAALLHGQRRGVEAKQAADALRSAHSRADGRERMLRADHSRLGAQLSALNEQTAEDQARYANAYPGPDCTGDARELAAPWQDRDFNIARSELFLAALGLHRAFIYDQAVRIRRGLFATHDVVKGACPKDLRAEARLAAWQLFFLLVPVVSTTFASMPRMFNGLAADSFGWLFIDEAGQCAPQHAAGGIWRAQRTVAVGDPIQLEPVLSVPCKVVRDIAASFRVQSGWIPPRASVQTLVDRVGRFGTTLRNRAEPVWVSAPLRVHRRCDNPMFEVCNEIGYEGLMVSAVKRGADPADPFRTDVEPNGRTIPPSSWLDTPADVADTPLQPAQIERLVTAIERVHAQGVRYDQMFALSPFRAVADRLEQIARTRPGLRGGALHNSQGRQADVVFLVLGGASSDRGAREWAASSPNLVNVAVSRAKRRLYVIGSHPDWSALPYFSVLAGALERVPLPAAGESHPPSRACCPT